MNIFNYQQRIAMMRILLDIIHADGRIDAREMFYFNQLKEELSLTDESLSDIRDKNSLMALLQIKSFDDTQKEYFAELMANMIIVDEDVNVNEVMIYDVVRDFTGIKQRFNKCI